MYSLVQVPPYGFEPNYALGSVSDRVRTVLPPPTSHWSVLVQFVILFLQTRSVFPYLRRAPSHVGTRGGSRHPGVCFDAGHSRYCWVVTYSHSVRRVLLFLRPAYFYRMCPLI